jgi:hypothetical protein
VGKITLRRTLATIRPCGRAALGSPLRTPGGSRTRRYRHTTGGRVNKVAAEGVAARSPPERALTVLGARCRRRGPGEHPADEKCLRGVRSFPPRGRARCRSHRRAARPAAPRGYSARGGDGIGILFILLAACRRRWLRPASCRPRYLSPFGSAAASSGSSPSPGLAPEPACLTPPLPDCR